MRIGNTPAEVRRFLRSLPCVMCGKPFQPWQRITPGPRHGACNPELQRAERDRLRGAEVK